MKYLETAQAQEMATGFGFDPMSSPLIIVTGHQAPCYGYLTLLGKNPVGDSTFPTPKTESAASFPTTLGTIARGEMVHAPENYSCLSGARCKLGGVSHSSSPTTQSSSPRSPH